MAHDKACSFQDLVALLPSVYPGVVLPILKQMDMGLRIGPSEALIPTSGPLPHPADADWRFAPKGIAAIEQLLEKHGRGQLALLGCPSLVGAIPCDGALLVERNVGWKPYISRSVRPIWGDLSRIPKPLLGRFGTVVADSPWYLADLLRTTRVAAALLEPNGVAIVTWPPRGTRPGIRAEWAEFIKRARLYGLALESYSPLAVTYATPFFEAQALRAAGVPVLAAWRRGDVAMMIKRVATSQPSGPCVRPEWCPLTLGSLELRVRIGANVRRLGDPRLWPLVDAEIIPDVSSRHPTRRKIVVWSGGNRGFDCYDPNLLYSLGRKLAVGASATGVVHVAARGKAPHERDWIAETVALLIALEERERDEYNRLHG
jgi:hypothetical protein